MAGIYIHIPFCKQACYYCDFHFSTTWDKKNEFIDVIIKEFELRKSYLSDNKIETIYFGGGTPSLLDPNQIFKLLNAIAQNFSVAEYLEITLEANPDDLSKDYLHQLKSIGVNRLSIGIQSFNDEFLKFMNRAHTANEAKKAFREARDMDFQNISIDLIYGIPYESHKNWEKDLKTAIELSPEHISSYCLTIEAGTVLGNWEKKNKFHQAEDLFIAKQYGMLIEQLTGNNYEQYEISNFARDKYYSQHNSAYWQQKKYLGVGPSAHSYNLHSRQSNVSNNALYMKSIKKGIVPAEIEELNPTTKINEYLMTSLRTIWGCDLIYLKNTFNYDLLIMHKETIERYCDENLVKLENETLRLTKQGFLFADQIAAELFTD